MTWHCNMYTVPSYTKAAQRPGRDECAQSDAHGARLHGSTITPITHIVPQL